MNVSACVEMVKSNSIKPLKQNRVGGGAFFIWEESSMIEDYAKFSAWEGSEAVVASFKARQHTVKDTGQSYRIINHWTSEGLLDDTREECAHGWRKFSLRDLLWLRVLSELRSFGMPLEKLRVTHESLFMSNGKPNPWRFEFAMAMCLRKNPIPTFLVVFSDGGAEVATLEALNATDELVGYQHPYLRINLNTLCCEMLKTEQYMPKRRRTKGGADKIPSAPV